MNNSFSKKLVFIFSLALAIALPVSCVLAQVPTDELPDPLGGATFTILITRILNWITQIGTLIAAAVIIWLGVKLIYFSDNEAERAKTLKGLWWAIIGLAIVLIGAGLIDIIRDVLGVPGTGGTPANDFYVRLQSIVRYVFGLAFAAGVTIIVWGLVDWARYGGDEEKMKAAKMKLVWGLIGIALIVGVNTLIAIVANFFGVTAPTI